MTTIWGTYCSSIELKKSSPGGNSAAGNGKAQPDRTKSSFIINTSWTFCTWQSCSKYCLSKLCFPIYFRRGQHDKEKHFQQDSVNVMVTRKRSFENGTSPKRVPRHRRQWLHAESLGNARAGLGNPLHKLGDKGASVHSRSIFSLTILVAPYLREDLSSFPVIPSSSPLFPSLVHT